MNQGIGTSPDPRRQVGALWMAGVAKLLAPQFLLLLAIFAGACGGDGCGGAQIGIGSDGGSPHAGDGGAGDLDGGTAADGGTRVATGLAISPANATLEMTDPASLPTLALTANATYDDGTTGPTAASWTLDRYDIASIGAGTGVLAASGAVFGKVTVSASALGLTSSAVVTVRLKMVLNPAGASAEDQALLSAAKNPDPAVTGLLYPYDKTVFPRALLAPELMWRGGANGDLYRVRLSAEHLEVSFFTKAAAPSRFTLPQPLWNALGASGGGGPVTAELRRLSSAGAAYLSAVQTWTLANANLRGTIYYWAVDQGQIIQLDVSTGTRTAAFDSGPSSSLGTPVPPNSGNPRTPPWEPNGAGQRCVACHAVSKDGSRLSGVFTRETSLGPLGIVNLADKKTVSISDYESSVVFTALTPDGKLAVANSAAKTMRLLDTATGAPIASALDALIDFCDPAFSPDGRLFAACGNCDPGFGYPVEYRRADLELADFDPVTRVFSNRRTVRTSAGVGDAIAYPSFSPDSKYVFYQRGSYARAKYGDPALGQYYHGVNDLYLARAEAAGAEVALHAANGKGVLPADSLHLNYAPTVNPIAEGGYFWVVFTSPRDYGNRMLSPQQAPPGDATFSNRKQLWVTAIDANIGSADPSHPAFWLPGQALETVNMYGNWSLSPCKPSGGGGFPPSCTAGFECCSGFCRDQGAGPVCVEVPPGCHQVGEKCANSSDCCNSTAGVTCEAGICQAVAIQ